MGWFSLSLPRWSLIRFSSIKEVFFSSDSFSLGKFRIPEGQSQQKTYRGSYLGNLIPFHDKVTYLVDEGKAVEVIFLGFSEAFGTVPHSILLNKGSHHATWWTVSEFTSGLHPQQVHRWHWTGRYCWLSGGTRSLSEDLDILEYWAIINSMKFNTGKCWVTESQGVGRDV